MFNFNNKYFIKQGIIIALFLSQALLGARLQQGQWNNPINLIGSQIWIFFMCFTIWFSIQRILQTEKVKSILLKTIICLLSGIIISIFFYYVNFFEDYPIRPLRNVSLTLATIRLSYRGLLASGIMLQMAHYLIADRKVQQEMLKIEHLKQVSLLAQLSTLKNQLSPHFLFNSLNVLKSGTTDEWSKFFATNLANIYRYILTSASNQYLVNLSEELDFLESYVHILKERFEDGLFIKKIISDNYYSKKIPPMSLQLLIENAIMHNIVSKKEPLYISIETNQNNIIVANNINPKHDDIYNRLNNNGIGLNNLNSRYLLISGKNIEIIKTTDSFTVKLPLINNEYINN